jgi:hypothetical protein
MLNSAKRFDGATVLASDGDAGTVKDAYFDDERWTVRYLVVQTSGWLNARRAHQRRHHARRSRGLRSTTLTIQRKAAPEAGCTAPTAGRLPEHQSRPAVYWRGPTHCCPEIC